AALAGLRAIRLDGAGSDISRRGPPTPTHVTCRLGGESRSTCHMPATRRAMTRAACAMTDDTKMMLRQVRRALGCATRRSNMIILLPHHTRLERVRSAACEMVSRCQDRTLSVTTILAATTSRLNGQQLSGQNPPVMAEADRA